MARIRVFWRGVTSPARLDADMTDEMRFHLEMETQRIMRMTGVDAGEAHRQAALAFGGVEKYRGAARDVLGLTRVRGLSLDLRLGVRMLRRNPGLTLIAVFALALAIGSGAAYLEFVNDLLHGRLPFPQPDRIVGIQNWDQQTGQPENRSTADFVAWRRSLSSFESLGAYRALDRNLITSDGRAEPARGVEISAAAFHIAQVPPLLGRTLTPDDERPGAPPVVVIGYTVWLTRFGGTPTAVGQVVHLGNSAYTVVGVMPAGFGFPVSHNLWVPLRLNEALYPPRAGAAVKVFGRLAAGVTLTAAQAELSTVAAQSAIEFPDTHRYLRPVIKPYVESLWSAVDDATIQMSVLYGANVLFLGLLGVCAANIATLVFARTATREAEISVRTALGASRARIAGQLFAEALVLSSIAAVAGLLLASYGLQWVKHTITVAQGMRLMFWWNDQLSPMTIAYAGVLTVLAALIVGVIPALKATGPHIQERLKHAAGASNSGLRLGKLWTGVIVAQVALTVVFLAAAGTLLWGSFAGNAGDRELTIPGAHFVTARLTLDREEADANPDTPQANPVFRATMRARYEALENRLMAEPGVAAVTYAARLPGMNQLEWRIEVDGASAPQGTGGTFVHTTMVGAGFFEALGAHIVAGRGLTPADVSPARPVAIVDQTFVRHVLRGGDAIGRQIREAAHDGGKPGAWIEIVGVVADLTVDSYKGVADAVVYRPALPDAVYPINVAVHVAGDPASMMSRLRVIAADVDPALRLEELKTMDQISANDRVAIEFFARLLSGASLVAVILATAGVYAMMSFTVARRTAEIGIRLALGASTRRIVWSTFSRALAQVGIGVLAGTFPASLIVLTLVPEVAVASAPRAAVTVCLIVGAFMLAVTALACVSPARRALHIQPTDALKST